MGTFAAAISGIRLASIKRFDLFGAYVIGFVTALGGGTIRDVMLSVPPFWFTEPSYMVCTFVALVTVWIFGRQVISEQITWFVFDTIGLSIFTVIGLEKALSLGHSWWVALVMGTITGAAGGVMRDVLINEVPLIFRKEIYALACMVGCLAFFALDAFGIERRISAIVCIAVIFVVRAIAIRYHLGVPVLSGRRLFATHHHHPHNSKH
ncbi:MAG: trimeric intracellular cation channel family protein [Kiritimatiellae bacterium]|nr:trimeric intracellular cation channel family protein [Kiritimatiellia bacterium]